jgi:hypothetical protein
MKAEIITTTLRDGTIVLGKKGTDRIWAKTYANRTQAQNAAAKCGPEWFVVGHHPFYVTNGK